MATKEEAKNTLKTLIETYEKYKGNSEFVKNERQICDSLIRPFFKKVLGWHVDDPSEFKTEYSQNGKRIDYLVCLDDISQFVVEAKALSHDIKSNYTYYNQAIQYAHMKDKKFAILTNFRHFIILECYSKVDNPLKAEIALIDIAEMREDQFNTLWNFSKDVWREFGENNPSFPQLNLKRRAKIDEELLEDMKRWRVSLLGNIKKNHKLNKYNFENPKEFEYIEEEVQRFIDRLIFICFCEDKGLEENKLKSLLMDKRDRFQGKPFLLTKIRELFSDYMKVYNSDLFDERGYCDKFHVEDSILYDILKDLKEPQHRPFPYDFGVIDADILGRVYENFLGHFTTGKKRFREKESRGKRKEQGIYYTPTYIVDYIVKNTLGELLKDKNLNELKDIKILDLACGSGSFLIKAFEVMDSHYEKKSGYTTEFKKNEILRNNIFGVDLDPKAVEIARFNLMLRAARKHQKLPMLNNNIKCGNSLIDDPIVAGQDKAFKWDEHFKEIMDKEGFDVVIGNPPYVRQEELSEIKPYLQKNYEAYNGMADLFVYFFEKELNILKEGGYFGMIVSNKWFRSGYGNNLRKFLSKFWIEQIIDFGDLKVFPDATIYPCIIIMRKINKQNRKIQICKMDTLKFDSLEKYVKNKSFDIDQGELAEKGWNIQTGGANKLIKKIGSLGTPLEKYAGSRIYRGILTGLNEAFIIDENTRRKLIKEDKKSAEIIKPILAGSEIKRYRIAPKAKYMIFTMRGTDIEIFPAIKNHLKRFEAQLRPKSSTTQKIGRKSGNYKWFEIQDVIAYYKEFEKPKIIWGNLTTRASFYLDEKGFFVNAPGCILPTDSKYVLGVLNSKLVSYYLKSICAERQGGFIEQKPVYVSKVPIKETTKQEESKISVLVDKMLSLNKRLNELSDRKTDERMKIEEEIKKTDVEIDEFVYKIYGITKEEQKIIEESLK